MQKRLNEIANFYYNHTILTKVFLKIMDIITPKFMVRLIDIQKRHIVHNSDILLRSMMNTDKQGNSILHPKNGECHGECHEECPFNYKNIFILFFVIFIVLGTYIATKLL